MAISTQLPDALFERIFPGKTEEEIYRAGLLPGEETRIGIPGFPSQTIASFYDRWVKEARSHKVLGLQTGAFLRVQDDIMNGHDETAGYTKNIDITSLPNGAIISIINGTGDAQTFVDVGLIGKLVIQIQGDDGYIHDAFIDVENIEKNGDRTITWGNDFVVTKNQTEKIADYLKKYFKGDKHRYTISLIGLRYYYHAGDWVQIKIGAAGTIENINSLARIASVETSHSKTMGGQTTLVIEEILENWKHDSNAKARFMASGKVPTNPSSGVKIRVAALGYIGQADIWCDGVAVNVQIQAAIDHLKVIGGGIVEFSEGTFVTAAALAITSNNIIFQGNTGTIIEKNGNFDGITATGGSGTELTGIELRDLTVTRAGADTNAGKVLINWDFVDTSKIVNIVVDDSYDEGIDLDNCDDIAITNCIFIDNGNASADATININTCTEIRISNCNFSNGAGPAILVLSSETAISVCTFNTFGNIVIFLSTGSDYSTITGCIIKNTSVGAGIRTDVDYASIIGNTINGCADDGIRLRTCKYSTISGNTAEGNGEIGIELETVVDDCTIADNICQNNGAGGIKISASNCDRNIIDDNVCSDNGADTGIDNSNNDNFDDQGTNTFVG